MLIKVVAVGEPISKQGKKAAYSEIELTYKSNDQTRSKKFFSFKKQEYGVVQAMKPGELYEVDAVKEGDFWEWKSITKSDGSQAAAPSSAPSTGTSSPNGYQRESAEERALRQMYIVRQSAISSAVNAVGVGKPIDTYLEFARKFEQYVFAKPVIEVPKEPEGTEVE